MYQPRFIDDPMDGQAGPLDNDCLVIWDESHWLSSGSPHKAPVKWSLMSPHETAFIRRQKETAGYRVAVYSLNAIAERLFAESDTIAMADRTADERSFNVLISGTIAKNV